ncbi:FHA domain-containing protein [Aeoliella mucimassa]|nr:FHA domain-containing protein [Aeoliella mucimassa]
MSTLLNNAAQISTEAQPLVLLRSDTGEVLLPLTAEKVTVGSGQSCTLRLTDAGVRPLHCLITNGEHAITIRRWADGTLLNGEAFSEAELQPGDRLTIGPVELTLESPTSEPEELGSPTLALSQQVSEQTEEYTEQVSEEQAEPADEAEPDIAAATVDRESVDLHRNRAKRLLTELRKTRREAAELQELMDRLNNQLDEYQTERLTLVQQRVDLQTQCNELIQERDELQQQRDALAGQIESLSAQLTSTRQELEALSESHRTGEAEFANRMAELEQQVTDRNDLVLDLRNELELLREELTNLSLQANDRESTQDQQMVETHAEPAGPTSVIESLLREVADRSAVEATSEPDEAAFGFGTSVSAITEQPTSPVEEPTPAPLAEDSIEDLRSAYGDVEEAPESLTLADAEPVSGDTEVASEWSPASCFGPIANPQPGLLTEPVSLSQPEAGLWDIEVKGAEPVAESFPTAETLSAEVASETTPATQAMPIEFATDSSVCEEPNTDEEAIWNRLHDLRAVASERLHHEIEEYDESHATEAGASPMVEEPEATPEESIDEPTTVTDLFDPPAEAEEPASQHEEPVSFVERYKHLLDEDGPEESFVRDPEPEPAPEPARIPLPEPQAMDDGEEESIEEYMAKMMNRLRGGSDPQPVPSKKPQVSEKPQVTSTQQMELAKEKPICTLAESLAKKGERSTEVLAPQQPLGSLEEMKSSSRLIPTTDMNALRDLANNSAREAIQTANSRQAREDATVNLLMGGIGLFSGAYLVWYSKLELSVLLVTGLFALAGAGYWIYRTLCTLKTPVGEASAERIESVVQGAVDSNDTQKTL